MSPPEELLNKYSSFSINHRILQFLTTEMFRVYARSAPDILNKVFLLTPELSYSLRNQQTFATRHVSTVHYGSD